MLADVLRRVLPRLAAPEAVFAFGQDWGFSGSGTAMLFRSDDGGENWYRLSPNPLDDSIGTTRRALYFHELGMFVAGHDFGNVSYSHDGESWSVHYGLLSDNDQNGFAYSPSLGRFVVSGYEGEVFYSDDQLQNFTEVSNPDVARTYGMAYSEVAGVFVAVANESADSSDGTSWTDRGQIGSGTSAHWDAVWVPWLERFVVPGSSGRIFTSPDGVSWTQQSVPVSTRLFGVAASDDLVVAVNSDTGDALTSEDGENWTVRSISGPSSLVRVVYSWEHQRFIAAGYNSSDGMVVYSDDGISWSAGAGSDLSDSERITAVAAA